MAASYDFVQLDVFTRTPLAGNPLAIFTDARGLTDKQMQALAREMNLSETTFILPREPELEATDGTRVRIFTTREELPFAGHPTLGTALYLYSTTNTAPDEIVLDLNVGKIPVRFTADSTRARNNRAEGDVFGEMRQRDHTSKRTRYPNSFQFWGEQGTRRVFSFRARPRFLSPQTLSSLSVIARSFAVDHHNAVIRIYDDAGNVIDTHEHKWRFQRVVSSLFHCAVGSRNCESAPWRIRCRDDNRERTPKSRVTSSDESFNQVPSINGSNPLGNVRRLPCPRRNALPVSC